MNFKFNLKFLPLLIVLNNINCQLNQCVKNTNCLNNGTFNSDTCSCDCFINYIGTDCSIGRITILTAYIEF